MKEISNQKNDNRNILSVDLTHNSVIDDWLNDECKRTSLSRQDIIRLTLIEKIDYQNNLGKWQAHQRHEYSSMSELSTEQIKTLEKIGFVWKRP